MEGLQTASDLYTLISTVGVSTGAFIMASIFIKYFFDKTTEERQQLQATALEERTRLTTQITELSSAVNNNTSALTVLANMIRDEYGRNKGE